MSRAPILTAEVIRKPKLTEADVQRTCTDLLIADGWRAIRTDPVSDRRRGKGFGEVGMPDYLYVRYRVYNHDAPIAQVLWVEYKAPRKSPTVGQCEWHFRERGRGALVMVVDDIEAFRQQYRESGLARNVR